jgi:predicted amidohydrolase YtcJ
VIADVAFVNAAVFTAEAAVPQPDSVAIRAGVITYVGQGVPEDMVGPGTEIIDARGASLLPGFIDAHVHPVAAGMLALQCDLSRLPHDRAGYLAAIGDYARTHPDEQVISGGGWYGDGFPGGLPTRSDIDGVVSDRPVVLTSHDGHGVWANTKALEAVGIDRSTGDPVGGKIVRDQDGLPTGMFFERAADPLTDLIPSVTNDFMYRALLAAQQRLHSVGVTGWQDAGVGIPLFGLDDILPTYLDADAAGDLTARVVGALWWSADRGLDQIEELCARRDASGHRRFRATTVKVMQDGICENCTAAMLAPYRTAPGEAETSGLSFIAPDDLTDITSALAAERFQIHMHAVGDRAVRECLDALEAAVRAQPDLDGRHQIAHLDIVDPQDVPRFAALGVVANIQALWARRDTEIVERKLGLLGPERQGWHFPFGSLHRGGATLAMGSDWPVTDPNPLWAIHTAVHRTGPRADPHAIGDEVFDTPLLAHERLDLRTAIGAYTAGSAFANHCDDSTGSITAGMQADLALLDGDIFDADEIGDLRTVLTMVGGEVVYRAD